MEVTKYIGLNLDRNLLCNVVKDLLCNSLQTILPCNVRLDNDKQPYQELVQLKSHSKPQPFFKKETSTYFIFSAVQASTYDEPLLRLIMGKTKFYYQISVKCHVESIHIPKVS